MTKELCSILIFCPCIHHNFNSYPSHQIVRLVLHVLLETHEQLLRAISKIVWKGSGFTPIAPIQINKCILGLATYTELVETTAACLSIWNRSVNYKNQSQNFLDSPINMLVKYTLPDARHIHRYPTGSYKQAHSYLRLIWLTLISYWQAYLQGPHVQRHEDEEGANE